MKTLKDSYDVFFDSVSTTVQCQEHGVRVDSLTVL